jgi:hypothetical protein
MVVVDGWLFWVVRKIGCEKVSSSRFFDRIVDTPTKTNRISHKTHKIEVGVVAICASMVMVFQLPFG